MAIDDDTLERIREALHDADGVDAARIHVVADGDRVRLQGAVPTVNQVDVAATVAQAVSPNVDAALEVDPNLREDTAAEHGATAPATGGDDGVRPSRRSTRSETLSTQVSEFRPEPVEEDLPSDIDVALGESLPWDPPDAPHSGTTALEQAGTPPAEGDDTPFGEDPDPDEEGSLPELSAADLARDARVREEER